MQPPCERFSLHLRVLCDSRPPVLSPLPTSVTREGGNERGGREWAETHIVLVRVGPMIALLSWSYCLWGARNPTLSSIVLATHSFQFKPRGRPVISALCCTRPNEMTSRPRPTKRRERGEGGAIESDCNFNFTIGPVKTVKLETDHKGRRRRHHQHPSVRRAFPFRLRVVAFAEHWPRVCGVVWSIQLQTELSLLNCGYR